MTAKNYLIRIKNGQAIQYESNGQSVRTVVSKDAQSGVVSGGEIFITMKDGKVRVYQTNGQHMRTIG
jgi:hypothetical protein